jgi:hypothetical protein
VALVEQHPHQGKVLQAVLAILVTMLAQVVEAQVL